MMFKMSREGKKTLKNTGGKGLEIAAGKVESGTRLRLEKGGRLGSCTRKSLAVDHIVLRGGGRGRGKKAGFEKRGEGRGSPVILDFGRVSIYKAFPSHIPGARGLRRPT